MVSNVRSVMHAIRNDDWDWLWTIDGRERVGKTALSTLVLLTAEPYLYEAILRGEYEPALARYSWDFDDMLDGLIALPKGSALCYQEASMLGREAMKSWNLRMVRVMTTVGSRNILFILTFPRYQMLDPYLRLRTRTRSHVRTHHGSRGYARCYYRATDLLEGDDDGMRYAFDTTFRDARRIPELSEFWAKLMEKEERVKSEILARHGRRASADEA